ncbi:MAG: EamA family transporter, partial [Candidatus Micrarchaeota archaeon]|nr:EamA family transporter [Candidatus Micrarchaeota archaeon]
MALDWFVYALAAAACGSGFWLSTRFLLRGKKEYRTAALFLQISSLAYWIPLLLAEQVVLPENWVGWAVLLAASLVWTIHELLVFSAQRSVEASVREPLFKTRLLWAAAIGFLVLGETITLERILGAGLVLAGALVVSLRNGRPDFSQKGALLVLAAAVASAVVTSLDDVGLRFFSVTAYAVFVTVPVAFLLWAIPAKKSERMPMGLFIKGNWKIL